MCVRVCVWCARARACVRVSERASERVLCCVVLCCVVLCCVVLCCVV